MKATRILRPVPKRKLQIEYVPLDKLSLWDKNPRRNEEAAERLVGLLEQHGFISPIIATRDGKIRAGHTRVKAARKAGMTEAPVIYVDFDSEEEAQLYSIADNKSSEWASWDAGLLQELFGQIQKVTGVDKLSSSGFTSMEIEGVVGVLAPKFEVLHLVDRFLYPPVSVFDSRSGYWQKRKDMWTALGLRSEAGPIALWGLYGVIGFFFFLMLGWWFLALVGLGIMIRWWWKSILEESK